MTRTSPVLVVVDESAAVTDEVRRVAEAQGFSVAACQSSRVGERLARELRAEAAVVHLRLAGPDGLEVLSAIAAARPTCRTILLADHATVDAALQAVQLGALGVLESPIDVQRLGALLAAVRDEADRRRHVLAVEHELARQLSCQGLVGRSPAMQAVFDQARRLAPHLRCALISGEAGAGCRSLARAVHALGARAERPFVVVDCAVDSPSALEAQLFGSVDATAGVAVLRPGLVDHAHTGVIYLADIARLAAGAQSKLLRLIEHAEAVPVGGMAPRQVDLVVLAGATSDLRSLAQAGRFRQDLLYRLSVVEFRLPPLRERREDIPYLVAVFAKEAAARLGKALTGVAPDAEALLMSAPWHGNVRELQSAVERACLMADGAVVSARDLASVVRPANPGQPDPDGLGDDGRPLSTVEREHIVRILQRVGGNKKAAARLLGVSRRALYRKLERLDLSTTISRRRVASARRDAARPGFAGPPTRERLASAPD